MGPANPLEKRFVVCDACFGIGLDRSAKATQPCGACQGTGVILSLPNEDFAVGLPLFVDFAARARTRVFKILLALGLTLFLLTLIYFVFSQAISFWQSLKSAL